MRQQILTVKPSFTVPLREGKNPQFTEEHGKQNYNLKINLHINLVSDRKE